jgi:MobA/VirD2-like, nuclease domain
MIPVINTRGHSFKGVTAYLAHDKEAHTTERVAWSMTGNMHTNDLEKAAKIMAFTDINANKLKREFGGSVAGRKAKAGGVYHYSLSWSPEENPNAKHQRDEALKTLQRLGLSEHQYYMVAHGDTDHKHVHIVANLTHPETGKRVTPSFDKRELSNYALEYEREHGLKCQKREENAQKRDAGGNLKHQEQKRDYSAEVTLAFQQSDNGKSFIHALEEKGLYLAKARRGNAYVIVDQRGDIQKLSRQLELDQRGKLKTKAIEAKFSDLDRDSIADGEALARQLREQQQRSKEERDKESAKAEEAKKLELSSAEKPRRKRNQYDRKGEKQDRLNKIDEAKARAAKRAEKVKHNSEKQPDHWDRDKANQAWQDKIDAAGIRSEEQCREAAKKKGQGTVADKVAGDTQQTKKPDERRDKPTHQRSYASYLDRARAYEGKEDLQRDQLEEKIKQTYSREQIQADLKAAREQATNSNTLWGRMNGKYQQALDDVEAHKKTLANISQRENEMRGALEKKLETQRLKSGMSSGAGTAPKPKRDHDNLEHYLARAEALAKEKAASSNDNQEKTQDKKQDQGRDYGGFER